MVCLVRTVLRMTHTAPFQRRFPGTPAASPVGVMARVYPSGGSSGRGVKTTDVIPIRGTIRGPVRVPTCCFFNAVPGNSSNIIASFSSCFSLRKRSTFRRGRRSLSGPPAKNPMPPILVVSSPRDAGGGAVPLLGAAVVMALRAMAGVSTSVIFDGRGDASSVLEEVSDVERLLPVTEAAAVAVLAVRRLRGQQTTRGIDNMQRVVRGSTVVFVKRSRIMSKTLATTLRVYHDRFLSSARSRVMPNTLPTTLDCLRKSSSSREKAKKHQAGDTQTLTPTPTCRLYFLSCMLFATRKTCAH